MSGRETILIRSYRRAFRLERRIYRVDRFALPVPGGIPLRGLLTFLGALLALLLLGRTPVVAFVLSAIPPPLRLLVLPAAIAVLATQVAPDGRPAHRFASSWLRLRLARPRPSTEEARAVSLPLGRPSKPERADAGGRAETTK